MSEHEHHPRARSLLSVPATIGPRDPDAVLFERLFGSGAGVVGGAIDPSDILPILKSLGKPLSELLDTVFTIEPGSRLPRKLKFTNVSREGMMQMHPKGAPIGPARFETLPADVDKLVNAGALGLEQPAAREVGRIQRLLREQFDAAAGDPRNPTLGASRETKSGMRATLDAESRSIKKRQYERAKK